MYLVQALPQVELFLDNNKVNVLIEAGKNLEEENYKYLDINVEKKCLNLRMAAAIILQSGIIQQAYKTKKLFLWDPFCGSGSLLLEAFGLLTSEYLIYIYIIT